MKSARNDFRVSIIVITKNRREVLRPCIQSILSQQIPFTELIIIDGSTDTRTASMIRALPSHPATYIRYINERSPGYAVARNRGIDAARCPWVAFTDDDCVLDNDWLLNMNRSIQKHPKADALVGTTKTYYSTNPFALAIQFYELLWKTSAIRGDRVIDPEILDTKNVLFSSRVFRKHHLRFRQEQYQDKLLSTDDIDLGMQFGNGGRKAFVSHQALIFHKDATTPALYIRKLLFDRFSYTRYVARWKKEREDYQKERKVVKKSVVFSILFEQYHTPWRQQMSVYFVILCSNIILRLADWNQSNSYESA
jgi:glycosyltransferase involved in cell wall biosynthesis